MFGMRSVNKNPAEQTSANFMAATNACAEMLRQQGYNDKAQFLTAANAKEEFKKYIRLAVAIANPGHKMHNHAFNALKRDEFDGAHTAGVDAMNEIGARYMRDSMKLAESGMKAGMTSEQAVEFAFNSLAGNPVFDHFGNLNLLAGQLYEEQTLVESFLGSGDAFAVPQESGGTNTDKSRFRAPVEQVTGSAKIMQGDINPSNRIKDDNNRTQISLYNEFKDAITLDTVFSITQAMRDQALGFEKAVSPALAGFILQNRYFQSAQKQVMKLAEVMFAFGMDAAASYTPNVGGGYGLISAAIQLALSDWNALTPAPAQYADWVANPTKLIQKIQNAVYLPTSTSGPLDLTVDTSLMYKDLIRLFSLPAQANVEFSPREWVLYVPTSWYALATQYPGTQSGGTGQGTFNKQLEEMVKTATGERIKNIVIKPSSLMNYGASNGIGGTNAYNMMALVAQGCMQETKPVIMPGQTAIPYIVSENVSATIMNFRAQYLFGGPMFMHYGGAFILEFSKAHS